MGNINIPQLCIGALLGVLTPLIFLIIGPTIQDTIHKSIVSFFGSVQPNKKITLAGQWTSRWYVKSDNYPSVVEDKSATIKQFGNRIVGTTHIGNFKCLIIGRIEQNRYITGTYHDDYGGGYFGAFQFIIAPSTGNFSGKWVGFSRTGVVKSDIWEWERTKVPGAIPKDHEKLAKQK